jgi:hypothetical protein
MVVGETLRSVSAVGGAETVSAAEVPVTPPLVAEMVAVPTATAVTVALLPLPETVATAGSLDCHDRDTPDICVPLLDNTVALAAVVAPLIK